MPAFGEGSVLNLSRPAAVKTGTTTDWRDNWTVGYAPSLVVGVWAGNADNSPMRHVSGVTGAAPIWHDFMEEVLEAQPGEDFVEPAGLTRAEVCTLSGQLPNPYCPHRRTELFMAGTEPTETCTMHQLFALDAATGQLASSDTPPERIVERVYTVLPAEALEWGRERGLDVGYWMLQAGNRNQEDRDSKPETQNPLIITSPHQGSVYRLDPALPREDQRIEVAVRTSDGVNVASVRIYVDEELLANFTTPPYRVMWPLAPGDHIITVVGFDADGNRLESEPVHITVK
jgi:membrane carboxypeptidase/penicillin-binding protein PbpC